MKQSILLLLFGVFMVTAELFVATVKERASKKLSCGQAKPYIGVESADYEEAHVPVAKKSPCQKQNLIKILRRGCDGKKMCMLYTTDRDLPRPRGCDQRKMQLTVRYTCERKPLIRTVEVIEGPTCDFVSFSRYCLN